MVQVVNQDTHGLIQPKIVWKEAKNGERECVTVGERGIERKGADN